MILFVSFPLKRFLPFLLPVVVGVAAYGASTQISSNKPVINFRLPNFTPEGYRAWLVRGSEGHYFPKDNRIEVKELTLSVFSGKSDDRLTLMMLSPTATVLPAESVVTSESTIRVINDDFEATGIGWRYDHKTQKTIIQKKVHVTLQAELKDFLQ